MALWNKHLADPQLTLVELDFIDHNIKNRSALLYREFSLNTGLESDSTPVRPPTYGQVGAWREQYRHRLEVLDSMTHMLRAIRARGTRYAALL
jgi:hypothetical protein